MKLIPKLFPLAALLLLLIPIQSGGQSGLFDFSDEATLLRKAKNYNLVLVDKAIFVDMRYKITSAAGKPLYPERLPCLVNRATGDKLRNANTILSVSGYALKVWDAWRPPEAHLALWDAVQDERYVVPPSKGLSWHCYGISVDVTLVKLDGTDVPMPTPFDEFSSEAASNYEGGDPEIAARVDLLQSAMREVGFRTIRSEWWHFDDMGARGGIRKVTAADLGIKMP